MATKLKKVKPKYGYTVRVTVRVEGKKVSKQDVRQWVQDCFDLRADTFLEPSLPIVFAKASTVDAQ